MLYHIVIVTKLKHCRVPTAQLCQYILEQQACHSHYNQLRVRKHYLAAEKILNLSDNFSENSH